MKNIPALLAVATLAVGLMPQPSWALSQSCSLPDHCPLGNSGSRAKPSYKQRVLRQKSTGDAQSLGGETLQAQLAGQWDEVNAIVAFPYQTSDGLDLQLVAMSLPATADGNEQYSAPGWHRELFFLDVGDSVPRLLSSYLVDTAFTPDPQDALMQSGQLWIAPHMLYQEAEELAGDPDFYSGYEFGAAPADMRFVADASGNVLEIAVDIYDDASNYLYSVEPATGDRYNPSFIGYDLEEPDVLYALSYFEDLTTFTDTLALQRRYHVPSGDNDPALPAGFDSAVSDVSVFMEGGSFFDGEGSFAYGPLTSLGYTWGNAKAQAPVGETGGVNSGAFGLPLLVLFMLLGVVRQTASRRRPKAN